MMSSTSKNDTNSPFDQAVTFIYVRDLESSSHFYSSILRLPLALAQRPPGATEDVVRIFAVTSTSFIGLCLSDPISKSGTSVVTDGIIFTLVTDSVDEWSTRLLQENVMVEKGPILNERYNIYHIFFRDPDGHLLEIQQFRDPHWPRSTLRDADRLMMKERAGYIFAHVYGSMPYIKIGKGDFTNGEIVSEKNMKTLFDLIRAHDNSSQFCQSRTKRFYDLGSGVGKAVIASALVCDWLDEFTGIEIQDELYQKSLQARDKFNTLAQYTTDSSIVKLQLGSFFDNQDWTINGDVIFINSTAFTSSTMKRILECAKKCKKGCYIVTLTHNLLDIPTGGDENGEDQKNDNGDDDYFCLIGEIRLEMSWGEADYFLHFKQI